MSLVEFTEYLVKSITKNPDMVKVSSFESDEDVTMLEIIVDPEDKGAVIGKNGKCANAIRTLVQAQAYLNDKKKVKINIDSF
ncbi:MAG: KH domain-containing protein [Bacilli bacterium]|nr:KH domain-containing protein [Bacilli bacterium]